LDPKEPPNPLGGNAIKIGRFFCVGVTLGGVNKRSLTRGTSGDGPAPVGPPLVIVVAVHSAALASANLSGKSLEAPDIYTFKTVWICIHISTKPTGKITENIQ
jgi:hypothetical protein